MSDTDTSASGGEPVEPASTPVTTAANGDDGRDPGSGRPKAKRPAGGTLLHRLYHGETTYDFVGKRRIGYAISGALILISIISLFTRGLNLGLDFEGGVSWEVPAKNGLTTSTADDILSANGVNTGDAKVQTLSGTDGQRLRIQVGDQASDVQNNVRTQLAQKAGVDIQEVSLRTVSPTWGNEITHKAERALVFFFIAIALYISIRFEWKMAVGAIVAVVHDVFISVGI
jgi:preprotein translocase subunit SecF